ncbi:MAG: hypothetical protein ABWW65_00950 [Thermoprotei archaeon]
MSSNKLVYKFNILPIMKRGKTRYVVWVYESGNRIASYKYILKPEYALRFLYYNQSLIETGYVSYNRKNVKVLGGTGKAERIQVVFKEGSERHAQLYMMFLISTLNLRSMRRVDKLAKCFSDIDLVSPVIDKLLELKKMISEKRFIQILRGYCLCLK